MQTLYKQISKNLIKSQAKNAFFTVSKQVNREAYAKQCFAQKMTTLFQKNTYKFGSFPAYEKLEMPALSPSMETGKIAKWNYKEGDKIEIGESICEVETDKSTVGFEATEELVLAKILIPEGEELEVGHVVAITCDEADVAAFKNFTSADLGGSTEAKQPEATQQQAQAPAAAAPQKAASSYPEHQKLAMPALSPSMETGKIAKWNVKEGDKVEIGDSMCEVETDKSTVGFETTEELYIAKILIPEGEELEVGHIVAIAVSEQADVAAFANYTPESENAAPAQAATQSQPAQQQQQSAPAQQQQQTTTTANGGRVIASPLAKSTAASMGVDTAQIGQGSGMGGRIIKDDVVAFSKKSPAQPQQQQQQQAAAPAATKSEAKPAAAKKEAKKAPQQPTVQPGQNPYIDIPNSSVRQIIAKRLLESKNNTPHFQLSIDVNVDKLLEVRKQLNANEGVKISVNDFVVKACSLALRDFPAANSQWLGDRIRQFTNADISIAVSTDGGLITPIVFEANKKGLKEISASVKVLAKKARENKLQPQEFQGGTFCVSNLGMFGIDAFTAIINPPQSCILAVSQSNKKMVYDPKKEGQEVPFSVHNIMNVCMSCDHRVVDGSVGAQFLQKFKFYIENPTNMLL